MEYAIEFNRLVKLEMEVSLKVTGPPPGRRPGRSGDRSTARAGPPGPSRPGRAHLSPRRRARRAPGRRGAWTGSPPIAGQGSRRSTACRPRRTSSIRRTSTCAPPRSRTFAPARRRRRPASTAAADLPDGTACFASFSEDTIEVVALDESSRRAGVTLEPLGAAISGDPATARRLLADADSLPTDDKLKQPAARPGTSECWSASPPADISAPVVVRWAVGAPGRAIHARTIVEVGDGADAAFIEELVPSARGRWWPGAVHRDDRDPPWSARPPGHGEPAGVGPRPDRVPAAAGDPWRGRRPPLGARPTRRSRRTQPGRQHPGRRPQPGRAGGDRVRVRFPTSTT